MKREVSVDKVFQKIGYMNFLLEKVSILNRDIIKLERKYEVFLCREEWKIAKDIMEEISSLSGSILQIADHAAGKGEGLTLLKEQVNKNISLIYEALRHMENAIDFDRKDSEFGLMLEVRCYPEGEQEKEKLLTAYHIPRYRMVDTISDILETEAPVLIHIRLRSPHRRMGRSVLLWTSNPSLRPKENMVPFTVETASGDIIHVYGKFLFTGEMETETLIRTLTMPDITAFEEMWRARMDTIERNKS